MDDSPPETPVTTGSEASVDSERFYVAEKLFRGGLSVLRQLQESNELRILMAVRGSLQFEIREDRASVAQTLERADLTLVELRRVVLDVSDCLSAAIAGYSANEFASVRGNASRFEDGEIEDPALATHKFQLATEQFDIEDLRRRAWIKETSPVRIARRLQWDVISKHATAAGLPPGNTPVRFGALRLVLDSALGVARGQEEFVITVDREDIGFMMDSLQQLLRALEEESAS
jgi:hypothetical protein